MKKPLALLLAVLLCAAMFPRPVAAATEKDRDNDIIYTALAEVAGRHNVRGCSLSVFEGGEIIAGASYGTAAVRGGVTTPASGKTIYRVASISKLVSCMLVMKLVEEDKLHLEDELATIIDKRLYDPNWPNRKPTLFHLLTHTSGIVDGAAYGNAISSSPFWSLDAILSQSIPFSGAYPGSTYSYSNFGMGLAAAAVEHGSGQRFQDYARAALFQPLGIDAAYMTDGIRDKASIAALGSVDPLSWGAMSGAYSQIPLGQMYLLAQGELYCSADSLAKIVMILAGDGTYGDGKRFLSQETIDRIHTPYVYDIPTNTTRGLAVQIAADIVSGVTLYGHQGNAYGVISCVFYDPATTRGVVFLTNNASEARAANYVYAVNDDILRTMWEALGWMPE